MDVQGPRGLEIGMRVVALGRAGARRRGAGEWQERRLVKRYGLGIRIAILIAISDTLISTAATPALSTLRCISAERVSAEGRRDEVEDGHAHRTAVSSLGVLRGWPYDPPGVPYV
jgi:hypothetical protein